MKINTRPVLLAAAAIALVGAASACGSSAITSSSGAAVAKALCTPPSPHGVCIDTAFAFEPAAQTVAAGTQVTWTNNSTAPHTATTDPSANDPAQFDTGTLQVGESKTITLTTPGTYQYQCSIHNYMKGTITVN